MDQNNPSVQISNKSKEKSKKNKLVFIILLFIALVAIIAGLYLYRNRVKLFGAALTWDAGGDGVSWNDADNWNPNQIPTGSDSVTISGDDIFVTADTTDISFGSLTIEDVGVNAQASILYLESDISSGGSIHLKNKGWLQQKNRNLQSISGNMTIDSGGDLQNYNGVFSKVYWSIGGNFINNGNVTGWPQPGGQGIGGGGAGPSGGGFGGRGGDGSPDGTPSDGGPIYGSVTNPNSQGSDGGEYDPDDDDSPPAGAGPVVHITVAGTATINSHISSNGLGYPTTGVDYAHGGGSGGTLYLEADTYAGTGGTLSAAGGQGGSFNNRDGGGGGGGRVAVHFNTNTTTNMNYTACGGDGSNDAADGAAGTVYLKDKGETLGDLIINNCILNQYENYSSLPLTNNKSELTSDANTAGLWHMNGDWDDSSTNANDGTAQNGADFTGFSVLGGQSGSFDGSDDTVDVGNDSSLEFERTDSFSIEAWIQTTSAGRMTIFGKANSGPSYQGYIFFMTGGNLRGYLISDWATTNTLYETSSATINDGDWHHVAMTYDGSSAATGLKLYIDGSEATTTIDQNSLTGSVVNSSIEGRIGSYEDGADGYFDGYIDELRVSDKERSSAEILADYNLAQDDFQATSYTFDNIRLERTHLRIPTNLTINGSGTLTIADDLVTDDTVLLDGEISTVDLTVESGAILSHDENDDTELYKTKINVSGDADIFGDINMDEKGYNENEGPGAGLAGNDFDPGSGGGYGGRGGDPDPNDNPSGDVYGDPKDPSNIGSGGGRASSALGGRGGGSITLDVTGTLQIDGDITANGEDGMFMKYPTTEYGSGGGSGGTINLTGGTIAGAGSIQSDGGDGSTTWDASGSGGGGRIALRYGTNSHTGTITAYGGTAQTAADIAAAGTIFTKATTQTNGELLINNGGQDRETLTELPPIDTLQTKGTELSSDTNTVGLWHMNNDWLDSSTNGSDGTAQNGATFDSDAILGSHTSVLDGTDDYIDLGTGSHLDLDWIDSFTLEAWIKTDVTSGTYIIVGKQDVAPEYEGYTMLLNEGKLNFYLVNAWSTSNYIAISGTKLINDNEWHYVAATYDGSKDVSGIALYVDGIRESSTTLSNTLTGSIVDSGVELRVGSRGDGLNFNGFIDEVKISSVDRSDVEIDSSYIQMRPTYQSHDFDKVEIENDGAFLIEDRTTINTDVFSISDGRIYNRNQLFTINDSNLTISDEVVMDGTFNSFNNVTVSSGGKIVHTDNVDSQAYRLNLGINGNLDIQSGGSIDVNERGFSYNDGYRYAGEGAGTVGNEAGGAGYGGRGGNSGTGVSAGDIYGDVLNPSSIGSGGGQAIAGWGGDGGGSVTLDVTGTTTIDGDILSSGGEGQAGYTGLSNYGAGGGSGGTINITTNVLTGAGSIIAQGGAGGANGGADGGGGGGGRIAIRYGTDSFSGTLAANGNNGPNGADSAAAGTIYRKANSQTSGDLTIANNNLDRDTPTQLPSLGTSGLGTELTTDGNTVGLYHLNNDWLDSSGNGNNGTPHNGVSFSTASQIGSHAGSLDGTDDFVDLGTSGDFDFERTDSFSIETWVKTTTIIAGVPIIDKQGLAAAYRGYTMYIVNGEIYFYLINDYPSANYIAVHADDLINDGEWHHVAVTYDGSSTASGVTFFIDGMELATVVDQDSLSASIVDPSVELRFGTYEAEAGSFFPGDLDEVRISDKERSPAEILSAYTTTKNLYSSYSFENVDLAKDAYFKVGTNVEATTDDFSITDSRIWNVASLTIVSGDLTVSDEVIMDGTFSTFGNITVQSGGKITHTANTSIQTFYTELDASGDVTIDAGGSMDVVGKGYTETNGPGTGAASNASGGGGYGGDGGDGSGSIGGTTYGTKESPIYIGSGGGDGAVAIGGSGGGYLNLDVGGTLEINGDIDAGGGAGEGRFTGSSYASGGGSAGSLNINANTISGTGSIDAVGGDGGLYSSRHGGGGGGGRIAFTTSSLDNCNLDVLGGLKGGASAEDGDCGTIYILADASSCTVSNCSAEVYSPPIGGFTVDYVIPASEIGVAGDEITVNFKIKDGDTASGHSLNTFEYSCDAGGSFNAPTNADSSQSLYITTPGDNWSTNAGSNYDAASTYGAAPTQTFKFDIGHADVTCPGDDFSTLQVRFKVNDGALDAADFTTSESIDAATASSTDSIGISVNIAEALALDCGADVDFGALTPGTDVTGSSTCIVTTNAETGYTLTVKRNDADSTMDHASDPATNITDLTAWNGSNATDYPGTGLGFNVFDVSGATRNATWWGTGSGTCDPSDSDNDFAGFPGTFETVMTHAAYSSVSTSTSMCYGVDVPSNQKSGSYDGVIIYQAYSNP